MDMNYVRECDFYLLTQALQLLLNHSADTKRHLGHNGEAQVAFYYVTGRQSFGSPHLPLPRPPPASGRTLRCSQATPETQSLQQVQIQPQCLLLVRHASPGRRLD